MITTDDYVYTYSKGVDDKCFTDGYLCDGGTPGVGWLFNNTYQWMLNPYIANAYSVFRVYTAGDISFGSANNAYGVRPCVYLKSNIQIKSGTGTQSNPYTI